MSSPAIDQYNKWANIRDSAYLFSDVSLLGTAYALGRRIPKPAAIGAAATVSFFCVGQYANYRSELAVNEAVRKALWWVWW